MDINKPFRRNGARCRIAEEKLRVVAIQPVNAVNDPRLRLGKPLGDRLGEKEVLGRARSTAFAQHAPDRSIAGPSVWQRPNSVDECGQGAVSIEHAAHQWEILSRVSSSLR